MTAPRRFRKKGRRKVLVRVDSGGCFSPLSSLFQPITVTPTAPGKPSLPLEVGIPSLVEPPGLRPILPPATPQPAMPTLPALPDLPVAARRRGCPGSGKAVTHSRASIRRGRRALICLLNKTRRRFGLSRLRGTPRLLRAATRHSSSMVLRSFFSHVAPGGVSPLDRILGTGYLAGSNGFVYGENIGFGEGPASRPKHMMRAWMNSTPHRMNILTRDFREVGLGVVPGIPGRASSSGATYTTVFGVRR